MKMMLDLLTESKFKVSNEKMHVKRRCETLNYIFQTFFVGIREDWKHTFHIIYFIICVAGFYLHFFFSLLLLQIVVKVPQLKSVVNSIA